MSTAVLERPSVVSAPSMDCGPSVMVAPFMWNKKRGLGLRLGSPELATYAFLWSYCIDESNRRVRWFQGIPDQIATYLGFDEYAIVRALERLFDKGLISYAAAFDGQDFIDIDLWACEPVRLPQ